MTTPPQETLKLFAQLLPHCRHAQLAWSRSGKRWRLEARLQPARPGCTLAIESQVLENGREAHRGRILQAGPRLVTWERACTARDPRHFLHALAAIDALPGDAPARQVLDAFETALSPKENPA